MDINQHFEEMKIGKIVENLKKILGIQAPNLTQLFMTGTMKGKNASSYFIYILLFW